MKKIVLILFLALGFAQAKAQSSDMVQLILDIEKLTQLKGILSDMKTGYTMIDGGYNEVKSIASGNLNLHTTFLNSLMMVSPAVAKYGKIAEIVLEQGYIVTEYTRFQLAKGTFLSGPKGVILVCFIQSMICFKVFTYFMAVFSPISSIIR